LKLIQIVQIIFDENQLKMLTSAFYHFLA